MKGIGLIRLSTAEQAVEGRAGIDRQKTDIAAAAQMHGVEIIRMVQVIESGAKVRGQRDFEQIFRDLQNSGVDGVICSNLDRLVRPDCFADYGVLDHFKLNRKRIFTPGGIIDPATQTGFMESTMRAMFAGYERQMISSRTRSGKEELRKQGRHPQGAQDLPRGVNYDRTSYQWSYDGVDSERVRRAYRMLFEGSSYRAIVATIGGGWSIKGIRDTMKNSIWFGVRTFPPTGERKMPLERRVIAEEKALIDFDSWRKAQDIIAGRKKVWGARLRQPRFLASGLLLCSCGKIYYTKASGRSDRTRQQEHYICRSKYPGYGPKCAGRSLQRKAVDAAVTEIVKDAFRDPALLLRMVELSGQRVEAAADTGKLQAQLARLEAKRQRFIDAYGEGDITKAEFQKRLDGIEADKRNFEAMLPAQAPALDAGRLVKAVVKYFTGFEHRPFGEQRQILRTAFKEFTVENGAITVATCNGDFLGSMDGAKVSPCSRQLTWLRCPGRR
ncbi:MAG: recombinase family protein [Bryobacteraceae bacterium]